MADGFAFNEHDCYGKQVQVDQVHHFVINDLQHVKFWSTMTGIGMLANCKLKFGMDKGGPQTSSTSKLKGFLTSHRVFHD